MIQRIPFPLADAKSQIEARHPHIFKRLGLLWGEPEAAQYIAQLVIDGRGGRIGFSRAVFVELMTLSNACRAREAAPITIVNAYEMSRRRLD